MDKLFKRIQDYSKLEIGAIEKRYVKLMEELGEWSAAYLEADGFKIPKTPKTREELEDHVLEEGVDTMIMVIDILFKQGFYKHDILSKMSDKLDAWEQVLIKKGQIEVHEKEDLGDMIQNARQCHVCGKIVVSNHVHEMAVCGCDNRCFTDGGYDYSRVGAKDMSKTSSLVLYDKTPFDDIKNNLVWGTYGKNGDQPLTWVRLVNCEYDHLKAILETQKGISPLYKKVIESIIEDREK
jgi:hypothetical protein